MKHLTGLFAPILFLLAACDSGTEVQDEQMAVAEPSVERGAYLVRGVMGCGHCHTPGGAGEGEGVVELAGDTWDFGVFHNTVPNITPDTETGIGAWSEDQIVHTLRTGERPDGTRLNPLMPWQWYTDMAESDIRSVAKFLKSVPAVSNPIARNPVTGTPEDMNRPMPDLPPADPSDKIAYGGYLVGIGHCLECHTKGGDFENSLGAGGLVFDLGAAIAVTANLTPHPEDGIPHYTVEDFKTLFKTGKRPDGTEVMSLMGIGFYKTMSDEDMEAIALYLKTLEPKPTPVDP